jgi:hypothetical protein
VISILKKRRSAYPPILINHLGNKFSFSLDSVSAPLNDVVEISAALPENLDWLDVGDNKWMELRTYLAEHEGLGRLINSAWLEDSNSMEVLTQLQPLFENAFSQRHHLSRDVISWPVTVDRIADRLRNGVHLSSNVRVLLVVLDCCSLPMGTLLLDYLRDSDLQLNRETATLAMEPTLSSISRKSIAAGSQPDESFEPLHSTAPENKLWKKYWRNHFDNTVRTHRIVMAERKQKELREHISNPHSAALFVVFNELDKLVHASCNVRSLRYSDMRNMAGRWMSDELVPFLKEATDHGWRIVITSDHGCTKITRRLKQDIKDRTLDQTARSVDIREMGERVIWPHENFISVLDEIEGRKIEVVGHPCLMLPAGMVSPRGSPFGFAHGGLSLEEILVPYIELGAW